MKMKSLPVCIACCSMGLFVACGQTVESTSTDTQDAVDVTVRASQSQVLARVNGQAITAVDVKVFADRLVDQNKLTAQHLTPEMQEKMLQALIRAKIFSLESESLLSDQEKAAFAAQVSMFKDELLTRHYIQNKLQPQPVTSLMVEAYYHENTQEFMNPGKIEYQLLQVKKNADEIAVAKAFNALKAARNTDNWQVLAEQSNGALLFSHAKQLPTAIQTDVLNVLKELPINEVSVLGDNANFLVKKINQAPDTLQPLSEVSLAIRKKLAPSQLNQAMTQTYAGLQHKYKVEMYDVNQTNAQAFGMNKTP